VIGLFRVVIGSFPTGSGSFRVVIGSFLTGSGPFRVAIGSFLTRSGSLHVVFEPLRLAKASTTARCSRPLAAIIPRSLPISPFR